MFKYISKLIILTLLLFIFVSFFDARILTTKFIEVSQINDPKPIVIFVVILSLLNIFIRPILKLLTLPFTCMTLGLFTLVINLIIVMGAEYFVDGFKFTGIWQAFIFSIAFSILSNFIDFILKEDKKN
ncbi:MAG: phage holin family protein [Chitinophagales bacterium]|jgi:putative membrane protein|nr:phage holin family protein [Chitinophagales bacterium]